MSFTQFYQLAKVDTAKHEIWGIAALEQVDQSGEIMDYAKSKPNFMAWSERVSKASGGKSQGNVRDSHTTKAVGKVIHLAFDDLAKAVRVGVKVLDVEAWRKVQEGIFTGFSIGGSYGEKWPDTLNKRLTRYEARPSEISLVDLPCMPGATFDLVKSQQGHLFKGANPMEQPEEDQSQDEIQPQDETQPSEPQGDDQAQPTDSDTSQSAQSASESEAEGQSLSEEDVKGIVLSLLAELGLVQPAAEGQPMQMGAKLNGLVKAQTSPLGLRLDDLQKSLGNQKAFLDAQLGELRKTLAGDIAQVALALDAFEKRGGPGPVIRDLGTISPNAMAEMQKAEALKGLLKDTTDPQTRQALQTEITRLEIKAVQTK